MKYVLVRELPRVDSEAFGRFLVSQETASDWTGETVLVFHRRTGESTSFWAVQEACPHAGISLAESDIEDFGRDGGLKGPCLACPAHMYVYDVANGECLSRPKTRPARTYPVIHEETVSGTILVYLGSEALPEAAHEAGVDEALANKLQLSLVEAGLKRRFGAAEDADDVNGV